VYKLLTGISFMFFGIILFCIVHIQSSNLYTKISSWNTPPGKYFTSIIESGGLFPFILAICLFLIGLIFALIGTFERNKKQLN